jgi:hypothetical protein
MLSMRSRITRALFAVLVVLTIAAIDLALPAVQSLARSNPNIATFLSALPADGSATSAEAGPNQQRGHSRPRSSSSARSTSKPI